MLDRLRNACRLIANYEHFERVALRAVQALLALMTAYAIVLVAIQIATDICSAPASSRRRCCRIRSGRY